MWRRSENYGAQSQIEKTGGGSHRARNQTEKVKNVIEDEQYDTVQVQISL